MKAEVSFPTSLLSEFHMMICEFHMMRTGINSMVSKQQILSMTISSGKLGPNVADGLKDRRHKQEEKEKKIRGPERKDIESEFLCKRTAPLRSASKSPGRLKCSPTEVPNVEI